MGMAESHFPITISLAGELTEVRIATTVHACNYGSSVLTALAMDLWVASHFKQAHVFENVHKKLAKFKFGNLVQLANFAKIYFIF